MSTLLNDIKYSFRQLRKDPGFTLVAVLVLALGIGANTAVFSVVDAVMLRPLPFARQDRIMFVAYYDNGTLDTMTGPDFRDWQQQNQSFEHLSALTWKALNLTGYGTPTTLRAWEVTTNYCQTLNMQPALGRGFLPEEAVEGQHQVAMLGHELWTQHFGCDKHIIGQQILLDNESYTVVGVMQKNQGPLDAMAQILVPLSENRVNNGQRDSHSFLAIGRLKPGVTQARAQADMEAVVNRLAQQYPQTNAHTGVEVMPLKDILTRQVGTMLWALYGVVCLALILAGINVASLLLARSETRRHEMAVRCALGAGRCRIIRQVLTESIMLSVLGAGVGILLGYWALNGLKQLLPAELFGGIRLFDHIGMDVRVLGFISLVALATGLLFGIAPAWHTSGGHLPDVLKQRTGAALGRGRHRLLSLLVVSEMALALVLLLGAGLLAKSFSRFQGVSPGFDSRHVLCIELDLPQQGPYQTARQRRHFSEQVAQRLAVLPGVTTVGVTCMRPLSHEKSFQGFGIEADSQPAGGPRRQAEYRQINPDFFAALKIPLKQGRWFTVNDTGDQPVMVVNETFAQRFFPHQNPLGRIIRFRGRRCHIVGVVGNVKTHGMGLNLVEHPPMMYEPQTQACNRNMAFMVKTTVPPLSLAQAASEHIWQVNPDQPIRNLQTMESIAGEAVAIQYMATLSTVLIAAGALLLAVIGIYGLSSYIANQRTREYGIRLALGARPQNIHQLALKRGMILTGLGLSIGLAVYLALAKNVAGLLYQVSSLDPVILVGIPLALGVTALLGCHIPARRAAKIDPMEALRYE
jgi:putative ABC transport system permease protein